MDEDVYRDTYRSVITTKCVFEKAINSRQTTCSQANKVRLADREAVSCRSQTACQTCTQFLDSLRNKALFALKLQNHTGPLPHAKEIKVQMGCIIGLALDNKIEVNQGEKVEDIYFLIKTSIENYKTLDNLPYENLMRSIVNYEGRPKRRGKKK